jgi:hypothetical protein
MSSIHASTRSGYSRSLAVACSVVSAGWAVFWLTQVIRGEVPSSVRALVVTGYFGLLAAAFAFRVRGRGMPMASIWPFPVVCLWLALDPQSQHQMKIEGMAAFLTSVALVVGGHLLERWRRNSTE